MRPALSPALNLMSFGVAPPFNLGVELRYAAWQKFYTELTEEKPENLDMVIHDLQDTVDGANGRLPDDYFVERSLRITREGRRYIEDGDFSRKLFTYLERVCRESEITEKDEKNRFTWNAGHDILRCLKFFRAGIEFLLPERDRMLTKSFIETLHFPPLEDFSYRD